MYHKSLQGTARLMLECDLKNRFTSHGFIWKIDWKILFQVNVWGDLYMKCSIFLYIYSFIYFIPNWGMPVHSNMCPHLLARYLRWHYMWYNLPTLKFIPKNTIDTLNQATQTIRDLFRTFVVWNRVSTVPSFFTFTNNMKICLSAVAKTMQINSQKQKIFSHNSYFYPVGYPRFDEGLEIRLVWQEVMLLKIFELKNSASHIAAVEVCLACNPRL